MNTVNNSSAPTRLLLRVGEAADRLGLSRSQAFKLVWSGELPSVRIGRAVRVRTTAVTTYVEQLIEKSSSGLDKRECD